MNPTVSDPTTHRSCVITESAAHFGDGSTVYLGNRVAHSLGAIVAGVTPERFTRHATIVVDGVSLDELAAQSAVARRAGWNHHELGPWTVFHRSDGRTLALGVRQAMIPSVHLGTLFTADTDPGTLALILDRYHQHTGYAWRGTFATTALNAIRLTWENNPSQPRWNVPRVGRETGAGRVEWRRALTEREHSWGYVHDFDANRAYLASALRVELAWSALEPSGAREFHPSIPGYWSIRPGPGILAANADPMRPPLVRLDGDGLAHVTTPYAALLYELDPGCVVVDSTTGRSHHQQPAGHRILRGWAEQLRDALVRVEQLHTGPLRAVLETATKRTYKDAVGGMQRDGMRISRRDWGHTIVDQWAAMLQRRIIRVHATQGVWPVEIKTDSVTYADCLDHQPRPGRTNGGYGETLTAALNVHTCRVAGCGCNKAATGPVGAWKHVACRTVEEYQAVRRAGR